MTAVLSCPGKINLVLNVTAKRADGYHELDTLFLPLANLADRLEADFDAAPGIRVRPDDDSVPADGDNLAGKAAARYAERAGIAPHWDFRLEKHIPAAAGLGGGSSDAAGALLLLNRRYGALSPAELAETARKIGADVPFFLNPQPAIASGIGEKLEFRPRVKLPPLVIVFPGFPVRVKWAYGHLHPEEIDPSPEHPAAEAAAMLESGDFRGAAACVRNALGTALWQKFPLLHLLKEELLEAGALAVEISGSGPSLFVLAPDEAARGHIARTLRKLHAENSALKIFEG